jgi:tellurite methyltransferase
VQRAAIFGRPCFRPVRAARPSSSHMIDELPSPFVVEWIRRVAREGTPQSRALDLAMGRGRHTQVLARAGFRTFGVDLNFNAVRDAVTRARAAGLAVHGWCADLSAAPLPASFFDLVVVTRYLERGLFPSIRDAAKPDGIVMYETFTTNQRRLGFGPRSDAHLLEPGELRLRFEGFKVMFYEEVAGPEAVARIIARRCS